MNENKLWIFLIFCFSVFGLESQTKDSIKYFDYNLLLNGPISRTHGWDIGVERIKLIKQNLSYAMQLSFRTGYYQSYVNPNKNTNIKYISICFQPYHLIVGKRLKFETGISGNLQVYRDFGKQLPSYKSFAMNQDLLILIYSIGLRYTFKKRQISIRLLLGPGYGISLQTHYSQFIQSQTGELSFIWRMRKKVKAKLRKGKTFDLYENKFEK